MLEKGMIKAVLKQPAFGEKARAKPKPSLHPAEPQPRQAEPTRARSARAGTEAAAEKARRAQLSDESEAEVERPPRKKQTVGGRAAATAPKGRGRKRPAAPGKAKASAKQCKPAGAAGSEPDSSDEDGAHL